MARIPNVSFATELSVLRIRNAGVSSLSPKDLVLTVVPEVETRIDEMLRELVSSSRFASTPVGSFLIKDKLDSYLQTWSERERILATMFGFNVSGSTVGQRFQLLLEVRNALMHGNGSLTLQQSKKFGTLLDLRKRLSKELCIEVQGKVLILDDLDRNKLCTAASSYLVEVDHIYVANLQALK